MSTAVTDVQPTQGRLGSDFLKFWFGQTISNFGSAVTRFVFPLLVFKLTGSALDLAIATAASEVPFVVFGLLIGAWVDRADRKKVMIIVDILRALVLAAVLTVALMGYLTSWWIYAAGFLIASLSIYFDAAELSSIPSMVHRDNLMIANGRIQASYAAASVLGPLIAGLLVAFISLELILLIDVASFLISAVFLALIRNRFNAPEEQPTANLRQDILEGLRYVWQHPVLRSISAMMSLFYLVSMTTTAQLVLFSKEWLLVSDSEVGVLYAAGGIGSVVLSLAAGPIRRRWSFSRVAPGTLYLQGILTIAMACIRSYWVAIPLWALIVGLNTLFIINSFSLRQAIVPNHLLGRVVTIAMVLASSLVPIGTLVGGFAIEQTGQVALIYGIIGGLILLITFVFSFSPIGHAEDYLPAEVRS